MMRMLYRALLISLLALTSLSSVASADSVRLSVSMSGVGASLQMTPRGELVGCDVNFCRYRFTRDTVVNVVAQPAARGAFVGWDLACSGPSPNCSVRLDANKTLYARFSPVALTTGVLSPSEGTLALAPAPLNGDCGRGCWLFNYGTRVSITAQPAPFRAFDHWEGDCGAIPGNLCNLVMVKALSAFPSFRCTGSGEDCASSQSSPLERSVELKLNTRGEGSVQVSSRQCNGTSCRSISSTVRGARKLTFQRGALVTLRASSRRVTWGGTCRGTATICQFAAFRDAKGVAPQVTATLAP